jgi:hypothetical protein
LVNKKNAIEEKGWDVPLEENQLYLEIWSRKEEELKQLGVCGVNLTKIYTGHSGVDVQYISLQIRAKNIEEVIKKLSKVEPIYEAEGTKLKRKMFGGKEMSIGKVYFKS